MNLPIKDVRRNTIIVPFHHLAVNHHVIPERESTFRITACSPTPCRETLTIAIRPSARGVRHTPPLVLGSASIRTGIVLLPVKMKREGTLRTSRGRATAGFPIPCLSCILLPLGNEYELLVNCGIGIVF